MKRAPFPMDPPFITETGCPWTIVRPDSAAFVLRGYWLWCIENARWW